MTKHNAAPAASARRGHSRLAAIFFGALLVSSPAMAGDRALVDIIGYGGDNAVFAFEEYGIQDGSGFPYANIYLIDLSRDRWVTGTPVRVRHDDENASLAAVRAAARSQADSILSEHGVTEPAQILALNGDGDPGADARDLTFGLPGYGLAEPRGSYVLSLETFEADAGSPCSDWFAQAPLGYRLALDGEGESRVVHEDETIPESRGCPFGYRIYGIATPFNASDLTDAVALLSVYPGGFEGPDRRFIAVPLGR